MKAHHDMVNEWCDKPTKKSSMDELEQVLDQAMFILSNPLRKEAYDRILLKYYLQKSQNENYKKYGVSCNNPWKSIEPMQQTDAKELEKEILEASTPKLKKDVIISATSLFLILVLFSYAFLRAYTPTIMISFIALFGAYIIAALFGVRNVYDYFKVRELMKPGVSAPRAVAYSSTLVYLVVPFLLIQGLRALPELMLNHKSPIAKVSYVETEDMWTTANFYGANEEQRVSLAYPDGMTDNQMLYNQRSGKLFVQYHPKFPMIARWKIKD